MSSPDNSCMDDSLLTVIATEEAKLQVLEREVAARRQRIEALRAAHKSMQQADEFDTLLAGRIEPQATIRKPVPTATPAPLSINPQAAWAFPTARPAAAGAPEIRRQIHKRGEVKYTLLEVLVSGPKRIEDAVLAMKELGYNLSYDRVRTQLWSFKGEGLADSPDKGVYQLTEQGKAVVERLKGESPGATGLSSATKSTADSL